MDDSLTKIFEVCIAAVTAIMGLAFPMFVERINGIVDKYGSPNISKKFKHETSYRCFNVLMVICIIELFVFPIIMMAVSTQFCNLLLISIQGICVFTLCMVIIRVYFLVMTYSDPHLFFDRIGANDTDEKKFLNSVQMLVEYGSRNDMYDDIYRKAMYKLVEEIFKFQTKYVFERKKSQTEQIAYDNKPDWGKVVLEYPDYILHILIQLKRSSVKPGNAILSRQPDIVGALYNKYYCFPITDKTYDLMWVWINGMVGAKHDVWMKRYWVIATQYFNSRFGPYGTPTIVNSTKEEKIFFEFHLMVGVLLLYQKRYDVLHYAFTFTNFSPPKYPLIPNTFRQIFDWCEKFPWSDEPFYISKYNMIGDYDGAKTESKIEVLLLDYLALLMIRLFSVDDYNITFSDPMSLPSAESKEYKINRIETIMWHLEKISDTTIKALDFEVKWKQDAMDLLEKAKGECEIEKENLKTRRMISKEKRGNIKKSLIEISKKSNPFMPSSECGSKENSGEMFLSEMETKLPDELILANHRLIQRPDLVESIIYGLHIKLREFYCGKLLQMGAIKTYLITYRDSGEVLKRLKLTSDYAIVALAVSPNSMTTTKGFNIDDEDEIIYQSSCEGDCIKVHYIPYDNDSILLIMKEGDVPRFKYRNLEESEYDKNEYSEIESEKHLYSNINKIKANNPVLKVKQGYYVHIPKKLEYVCIRVLYRLEPNSTVVSNVEPIKNLIK